MRPVLCAIARYKREQVKEINSVDCYTVTNDMFELEPKIIDISTVCASAACGTVDAKSSKPAVLSVSRLWRCVIKTFSH
jgi:hypothetical protein